MASSHMSYLMAEQTIKKLQQLPFIVQMFYSADGTDLIRSWKFEKIQTHRPVWRSVLIKM